jgi:hypothetical protein
MGWFVFVILLNLVGTASLIINSVKTTLQDGTINLSLDDLQSLRNEDLQSSLLFNLTVDNEVMEQLNDQTLNNCLLINGETCRCISGSIFQISFPVQTLISCISNSALERPLWLSLHLSANEKILSSTPFLLNGGNQPQIDLLTMILPLTLDDLPRAVILLDSLQIISSQIIYEFLIITPDNQRSILEDSLSIFSQKLSFPTHFIAESSLFARKPESWKQFPYATQMAIKLLVAKTVKTSFYLTLDADHILLHSLPFHHLFIRQADLPMKAVYHSEDYSVHEQWWEGSKKLLSLSIPLNNDNLQFGVTPAVLSSWGSLMTLSLIESSVTKRILPFSLCDDSNELEAACSNSGQLMKEKIEGLWLESLGVDGQLWTEYTLYRISLEVFQVRKHFLILCSSHIQFIWLLQVFPHLHTPETPQCYLHCQNVWFREHLPWNYRKAMTNQSCLFSVVQSNTGASPGTLLNQYWLFKAATEKQNEG